MKLPSGPNTRETANGMNSKPEADVAGVQDRQDPARPKSGESEFTKLDAVQLTIDGIGIIPAAGNVANGVNGVISIGRAIGSHVSGDGRAKEHWINAGISAVCIIPIAGNIGKGAQLAVKGAKAVRCVSRGTKVVQLSQRGKALLTASKAAKCAIAAKGIDNGLKAAKAAGVGVKAANATIRAGAQSKQAAKAGGAAMQQQVGQKAGEFAKTRVQRVVEKHLGGKMASLPVVQEAVGRVGDAVARKVEGSKALEKVIGSAGMQRATDAAGVTVQAARKLRESFEKYGPQEGDTGRLASRVGMVRKAVDLVAGISTTGISSATEVIGQSPANGAPIKPVLSSLRKRPVVAGMKDNRDLTERHSDGPPPIETVDDGPKPDIKDLNEKLKKV